VRDVLGLARTPRGVAERLAATLLGADPRVARTPDGRWTLVRASPSPALDACRFAVVDVEATGPSPGAGGRIIELAVVELAGDGPRLALETLVQPGQPIAPAVARLTGISDAVVRDAPRFGAVADRLVDALSGRVFVAHHVQFDWGLVAGELARSRALLLAGPRLCTVRLARRLLPPLASRTLDALARYFGFAIAGRHRAAPDAWAAARILAELLGLARARGAATLADLLALRGARPGRRARPRTLAATPARAPSDPSGPSAPRAAASAS
jgi:DNA polymerase-3 subunit epsilon